MINNIKENLYFNYRKVKGMLYSALFLIFRIFKIQNNKIVVSCFYGELGYGCSPKYIVEELVKASPGKYKIIWLVNDTNKKFPVYITKIKNNVFRSAYHLSTAKVWIDNDKKKLGTKKRKGQYYINTWHGPIGFKTVGLLRKEKYSKIAQTISKRDCDMTDLYISNSKWCTDIHTKAYPYKKEIVLEKGMPRTDPLLRRSKECRELIHLRYNIPKEAKIVIYAPTFRGGLQKTALDYKIGETSIDSKKMLDCLEKKFGNEWYLFLRYHPKVSAGMAACEKLGQKVVDISAEDDFYEIIAGADVLVSDFSSCAFDACYKRMPVFLYVDDYDEFVSARDLYWDMKDLPFSLAKDNEELSKNIMEYNEEDYQSKLTDFFMQVELKEDGYASERIADIIREVCK